MERNKGLKNNIWLAVAFRSDLKWFNKTQEIDEIHKDLTILAELVLSYKEVYENRESSWEDPAKYPCIY